MDDKLCQQHVTVAVSTLREHFDIVQILVSWDNETGTGTRSIYNGSGNWFARQGMARDFIQLEDAQTMASAIKQSEE